ncbi:hypothetical protein [Zobellia sp. B3R18]|uniref:hypothetical protein n=1 Tax=Zobellia sp. B3R18 TaxID=2841568 RepID=UPI001C07088B|nr:hypothetical protein [Zobellia sp. B3R18]MBU2972975.1 hypothetical protein [Zobellia sp. B3R18]
MKIIGSFSKLLTVTLVWFLSTSFIGSPMDNLVSSNEPQILEFNVDGLYFAEFYDYIFKGHFEEITMKREDMEFLMIFGQYLRAYGGRCAKYLPEDKVEIMDQVCATEEITRDGFGTEISRVCVRYEWVGSGLYARPDLYEAKMEVEGIQRSDGLRTTMQMILDPNAMGNSVDMIHKTKGLQNDMVQLYKLNACDSPGLRRFEENLKRFALNEASIRAKERSKYTEMKASGGPTGTQNFTKLVDDLVGNQAKTWAFNRYVAGSVSGVTVSSRDGQGRPTQLSAGYTYSGFSGNSKGSVRITFENGLPKCIYFFDFPQNCKTPNSSISASYAQGDYAE